MNQVYLPGNTTLQIQQAINRLLSIIGSSKTGSGVFIWTLTKTWQTLYDEIQASGGAGIVLVETDGSTNREMTDNGGNPTDLGGLYFIGLAHHSGAYPAINIDSAGGINGLFNLGGNHVILSKNIHWSIYHRIGNDQNFDLQLDGGSWYQITDGDSYRGMGARIVLTNQARTDGTNCTNGLFISPNDQTLIATDFSDIGAKTFWDGKIPGAVCRIYRDSSCQLNPSAVVGTATLQDNLIDNALRVFYDDNVNSPAFGVNDVQEAIDAVKSFIYDYQNTNKRGNGIPEGAVIGNIGDTYMNLNGGANTTFYVKESNSGGNIGWVGK